MGWPEVPEQHPATIAELEQAAVVRSTTWLGVRYEIRNHLDGFVVVRWSADPVATVHHGDQELFFNRAVTDAMFAAAPCIVEWDELTKAAAVQDAERWAVAWVYRGEPGFAELEAEANFEAPSWRDAQLALADRLDAMALGDRLMGDSNTEDEIARAAVHRTACDIRSAVALAELGNTVRHWQPHLQEGRLVSQLARALGVERKFLYRVFAGEEWRRRDAGTTDQTAGPAETAEV